jgi:hypothetical protein
MRFRFIWAAAAIAGCAALPTHETAVAPLNQRAFDRAQELALFAPVPVHHPPREREGRSK